MNGLGLPKPQPSVRELREQLALAEACEPIEQELQDAKAAYRDALDSGDPDAIAAAKQRKQVAANRINETRTWLRGEEMAAKLSVELARTREELGLEHWQPTPAWTQRDHDNLKAMQERLAWLEEQVPVYEALVAPYREALGSLPTPAPAVEVEDGSASVSMPAVQVKAKAMKGGK